MYHRYCSVSIQLSFGFEPFLLPFCMLRPSFRILLPAGICLMALAGVAQSGAAGAAAAPDSRFVKHILTSDFISEGVAIADVNRDGKPDILAGAYWFEAPNWTRHALAPAKHYSPTTEFSNSFLDYSLDVNLDGWLDLIRISLPGEEAVWYENPGTKEGYWPMHPLLTHCGNESPAFVDVDGDGRPDLLCNDPGTKEMIWLKAPVVKGDTVWKRYVIAGGGSQCRRHQHQPPDQCQ